MKWLKKVESKKTVVWSAVKQNSRGCYWPVEKMVKTYGFALAVCPCSFTAGKIDCSIINQRILRKLEVSEWISMQKLLSRQV